MADWAIGDVQGCYKELKKLCKTIGFKAGRDRLWLVGDLVNRGPKSLDVLRFTADLGDSAKVALGNHDLHLLAIRAGYADMRGGDTLEKVLNAKDGNALMDWLQQQPLIAQHEDEQHIMVHAGIPPCWTVNDAIHYSQEVEQRLQSNKAHKFFKKMYGNKPANWSTELSGPKRRRYITNALTRMRFCTETGGLEMKHKGAPEMAGTETIRPWYDWRQNDGNHCLITGHWSALGIRHINNHVALDTGCVWGGELTAFNLQTQQFVQVASAQPKASFMKPKKKFKPKKGPRWRAFLG